MWDKIRETAAVLITQVGYPQLNAIFPFSQRGLINLAIVVLVILIAFSLSDDIQMHECLVTTLFLYFVYRQV